MNMQDLNNLDFGEMGEWPAPVKIVFILILCAAAGFAWYWFVSKDQIAALQQEERKEVQLKAEFEEKQAKVVNLDQYRQQLEEMKQSFGAMLRQLPNKTEVAALLVDVSQTGLAAGLEFDLFQPQSEISREFYAELPIRIQVQGAYHEFGDFVSGLAALPRIVTIHDVNIQPQRRGKKRGRGSGGD
ncbi:MAG: type 4a pilus biogenesis protein PilO, partial [Chromatiales bacterium]